jgi:hypothetical protein
VKEVKKTYLASRLHCFMVLFVVFAVPLLCAQQKPPVFRAKIDLMQLDVTVLDKKGVPVRGLTKDDFVLLEDDKPQTIEDSRRWICRSAWSLVRRGRTRFRRTSRRTKSITRASSC